VVLERLGEWVYGFDDDGYEQQIGRLLAERGAQLATAESCTGGQIGDLVTSVPGSSRWYRGGVVAYSNALKQSLLGVDELVLTEQGAVSEACARAMAEGVVASLDADYGLAVTGIAGPDGGTEAKPVGLVYLAFCDRQAAETVVMEKKFTGTRALIKERTTLAALELACRYMMGSES